MNYKVMAISAIIGVGLITIGLWEAQRPPATPHEEVEHMSAMDIAPAETSFGFAQASSDYPPTPRTAEREESVAAVIAPALAEGGEFSLPDTEIPVGMPQIAYVFTYGYRVPGDRIPALQQRHADLCESRGPQICRIIAMDQSGTEGEYSSGTLQLAVASTEARAFGKRLATLAEGADGEQVAAAISGEDLSKSIVDTEARLRARTLLRDRLMEVLATRRGTVTELVEAERGVAQVNEEIDQARSWLSEMKSRVAFSRLDITYASGQPTTGGFMEPVRAAVGSLGPLFGNLVGVLIVLGSLAVPLLAIWLGARALWRRAGWRWPSIRQAPAEA